MRYYSGKGFIIPTLIGFLAATAIFVISNQAYGVFAVLTAIIAYFSWMLYDTYYMVEEDQLLYKSALLKGAIPIHSIAEIDKNKRKFSGLKASLSTKGMVIRYNKWDDIYISHKDPDQFISALKSINPNIKTVG